MKFVLCLIFIPCFVIDDDIFGTNAKQAVGAVKVPLLKDVLQASIGLNSPKENDGHGPHGNNGEQLGHHNPHKCACVNVNGPCECDRECCSLNCSKGHCSCGAKGAACRVNSDCCVGICRNGTCGTCVINQETCNEDSDCCRGKCKDNDGLFKQCECQILGVPCTSPRDCCGGTCQNDVCECLFRDFDCDPKIPDSCCFGTCGRSSTGQFQCIGSPLNSVCYATADCESSVCKDNRCSCNVVGETCDVGLQQCCQGLNCNGNTGTSLCQK